MTVNQILSAKGNVHSIVSSITVYEALKSWGKNVGAVLVIEDNLLKYCLKRLCQKNCVEKKLLKILLYVKSWREMLLQLSRQIISMYGTDERKTIRHTGC
jgi:hypothetical protein